MAASNRGLAGEIRPHDVRKQGRGVAPVQAIPDAAGHARTSRDHRARILARPRNDRVQALRAHDVDRCVRECIDAALRNGSDRDAPERQGKNFRGDLRALLRPRVHHRCQRYRGSSAAPVPSLPSPGVEQRQ